MLKLNLIKINKVDYGLCFLLLALPMLAHAHAETGVAGGFFSGFLHPILGPDHLVAMVAVGLWGAQLRQPAIWVLPVAFPMLMAIGGVFGLLFAPLAITEWIIALSAVVLGISVAVKFSPALWIAGLIVSIFAFFHGYAHGNEIPASANPLAYGVGFVVSTGLLHLLGITLGILIRWPRGSQFIRALGAAIGALGLFFITTIIS